MKAIQFCGILVGGLMGMAGLLRRRRSPTLFRRSSEHDLPGARSGWITM